MINTLKKIFCALLFGLFFCFYSAPAQAQSFYFEDSLIGEQSPDFTLKTLKQEALSLKDFRQGKPVIVFFWATWCPHCREQLKLLSEHAKAIEEKGIKVALVDLEEPAETVEAYMQKYSVPFDVFFDEEGQVAELYSIIGVPTFFFIDQAGIIQGMEHVFPEDYEEIIAGQAKS